MSPEQEEALEVTCVFWDVAGIHCGAEEKRMNLM